MTYRGLSKRWGVCPITAKLDKYTPGNWGIESIDCDECPNRCPESIGSDGFENENGRYVSYHKLKHPGSLPSYHGDWVFRKPGFSIFKHPMVLEMKEKQRE